VKLNLTVTGHYDARFDLCGDFRACPCAAEDRCPCRSDWIVLLAPLVFDFDWEDAHYRITLKPGLAIDGASIPRFAWTSVGHPFSAGIILFATLHDYFYASQAVPRETADAIFDAMNAYTLSGYTRWKIRLALRLAGAHAWREKNTASITRARALLHCEITPAAASPPDRR